MSSQPSFSSDLLVLTADSHQEAGIRSLLASRLRDLGLHAIRVEVRRHPRRDPGVYCEAAEFLRPFLRTHRHALVIIDAAWEGAPPPSAIRSSIQRDLDRNGWLGRGAVVVIDPELEVWCWVEASSAVEAATGLTWDALRLMGAREGHWAPDSPKPSAPKELLEAALHRSRTPRSAGLYAELAKSLPLSACVDPAFLALRGVLVQWFGVAS